MFYLVTSPWWMRMLYPSGLIWNLPTQEKILYLTFDDGPHPVATPIVLDLLKRFDAKATFFCIGNNVLKYPEIYKRILMEGHRVGNHTHNHCNGWKTPDQEWVNSIKQAAEHIDSNLFRPPYGRLKRFTSKVVQQHNPPFKIIMWDVLSADFDLSKTGDQCFQNVRKHARNGSVVVFHDSEKALPRMEEALKKTLEYFTEKGYRFIRIEK
ncbi:MAG: polysaccharide deacetylase family protein [Lacibacter sp.]